MLFYILRIIGWDNGDATWLSWVSPFGWVYHIRAFAGDDIGVFGIFLIFIAGLIVVAYWLSSLRDVGSGIITQRPGPAHATKSLNSSLALAWRLHRGMLLFWVLIFGVMGAVMGSTFQSVSDVITSNPQFLQFISQIGNASPAENYFALVIASLGEIFAVYGILATLRLKNEESRKYSEMLLTNSVSRSLWAISNLVFAVIGPLLVIITFSLAMGLVSTYNGGDLDILRLLEASLVYLPAIWIMTGITMLLFGLIPRFTALCWAALASFVIIDILGEFSDINEWLLNLSPFSQVPKLLVGDTVTASLGWILVVAVVLMVIGVLGFRRRDING